MHFFALSQGLRLDTPQFHRQYLVSADAKNFSPQHLYLTLGHELRLIADQLQQNALPGLPPPLDALAAGADANAQAVPPGLHLIKEHELLGWPPFPTRLGRISSRFAE